jgi:hypothetical protein
LNLLFTAKKGGAKLFVYFRHCDAAIEVARLEPVMDLGRGLGAVRTGQMQGAATRQ